MARATDGEVEASVEAVAVASLEAQRAAMDRLEQLSREGQRAPDRKLRARLARASPREKFPLAVALARVGGADPAAARELFERLGDSNPDMRWAAVKALEAMVPRLAGGEQQLGEVARNASYRVRRMALACLADLGWPQAAGSAVDVLGAALASHDVDLRVAALTRILRGVPQGGALADRVRALLDVGQDLAVRRVAAVTLGELGEPGSEDVSRLEGCLSEPDLALARAARRALRRLEERTL